MFLDLPFLNQMGLTTIITMLVISIISWYQLKGVNDKKGISISQETFKTDPIYNIGAFGIMILLAVIYAAFWS